jgi:hypothetical protein
VGVFATDKVEKLPSRSEYKSRIRDRVAISKHRKTSSGSGLPISKQRNGNAGREASHSLSSNRIENFFL